MKLRFLQKALASEFSAKRKLLLLLDFDGTLVPIANRPEEVKAGKELLQVLRGLLRRPGIEIFVLSGRPRSQLTSRLPVRGLRLIGDHGFDGTIPNAKAPIPRGWERRRAKAIKDLEKLIREFAGSWIEKKKVTATVHFRELREHRHEAFLRRLQESLHPQVLKRKLRLRSGKLAIEILPPIQWGKGELAKKIVKRFQNKYCTVVIGDDWTDEEMFRALPQALSVRIGGGKTSARFRLANPRAVVHLLNWLSTLLSNSNKKT